MKQLKSTFNELHTMFTENVTVKHIYEPLKHRNDSEDAHLVKGHMENLHFDVMGVSDPTGLVYGYVRCETLTEGPCKKYAQPFTPRDLVSDSTPLLDVITILHDTPRIFVLETNRVTGIVTRGDLQKAPVRMLLFGLITILEMHLLRLIRTAFPNDSWKLHLTNGRLDKAYCLYDRLKQRNEELDVTDCLQLCDKRTLFLQIPTIHVHLNVPSPQRFLQDIERLRNNLAHAQDVINGFSSWVTVIELIHDLGKLLKTCESLKNDHVQTAGARP
jgi:hypothetical protein